MSYTWHAVYNFNKTGLLIRALLWAKRIGLETTNGLDIIEKLAEISLLLGDFPEARFLAAMNRISSKKLGDFVETFIQHSKKGYSLSFLRSLVSDDEDRNVDGLGVEDRAERFYVMPDQIHMSLQFAAGRVTSTARLACGVPVLVEKAWEVVWGDEIDSGSDPTTSMMKSLFRRLYSAWKIVNSSTTVGATGRHTSDIKTPIKHSIAQIVRSGTFKTILGDAVEGRGFFPCASLFRHSCMPNVEWFNLKDVIVLLTADTVDEGQELFISLIDHTQCFDGRAEELYRLFKMFCVCQRCIVERKLDQVSRRKADCSCRLCREWKLKHLS